MVSFTGAHGERVSLTVLPRSAFAIFQYLGRILAAQSRVRLLTAEAIDVAPFQDEFLFTVHRGVLNDQGISGPCFLTVAYEGDIYCVPMEGAANTKRILSLLTQLIALNTTISDIPVTQTVRIIP